MANLGGGKITAYVSVNMFIGGNRKCHTIDDPYGLSGKLFSNKS